MTGKIYPPSQVGIFFGRRVEDARIGLVTYVCIILIQNFVTYSIRNLNYFVDISYK